MVRLIAARFKARRETLDFAGTRSIFTSMDWRNIITFEDGKRSGKPCIRGLRITFYGVLEYLAGGMTPDEIVKDFPELRLDDIRAALSFAVDRERRAAGLAAE